MFQQIKKQIISAAVSTAVLACSMMSAAGISPSNTPDADIPSITANAASQLTFDDFPSEYRYAADWIWDNRISVEDSTGSKAKRYNSIFDQIIAGEGTINYVVRWQSYKQLTLEQRQKFENLVSKGINDWNKWLAGYENWPYQHIDVNIVGWAVIDESCILDRQPDEIVYTNLTEYVIQDGESQDIPTLLPNAPSEISRFDHFFDKNYQYPGGLDKRFDMYLWATYGFPSIGGCGGDWGQRLSDDAYINMLDGSGIHVYEHELGHGFGMTDFYGGEGESNGFPPGGFPGGGTSLMMAGSSSEITDFDGWMLRYMWTKIKDESGRFNIKEVPVVTTVTTDSQPVITTTTTTTSPITSGLNVVRIPAHYYGDGKWNIKVDEADAVEITFSGAPHGGAYGVISYSDGNEEKTINWEERLNENGIMTFVVPLPENLEIVTVQKYYAGVWDNDLNDMKDIDIELTNAVLLYDVILGDVDMDGSITENDAELVLDYYEKVSLGLSGDLSESQKIAADINKDGVIDANDADLIRQIISHNSGTSTSAASSEITTTTTVTTTSEPYETTSTSSVIEATIYGDSNLSGDVEISDAAKIMSFVSNAEKYPLTDQGYANSDVYQRGDGVNNMDALAVRKKLAQLISDLPES